MSGQRLLILYNGLEVGHLERSSRGRLSLLYAERWERFDGALALSLSLPLGADARHETIEAWLQGLLPDNAEVLERWGRRSQVSGKNAFGLLADGRGEDCPGAFQLVRPERIEVLRAASPTEVVWLGEGELAERLRALRTDVAAWRKAADPGQFSLAGAQPKTALLYLDGRWGLPSGRTPTTHILKPPIAGLDGHAENEHLCLNLARAMGLRAVRTAVWRFQGEVAIGVERFDRAFSEQMASAEAARAAVLAADPAAAAVSARRAEQYHALALTQPILRLHQEDLCQALGVPPNRKYQSEGGPGPQSIVKLIRQHALDPVGDCDAFLDGLGYNWLIAGTDGHAKNYAFLHSAHGRVALAPLYDIASALPYPDMNPHELKLAMKVGSEYRLRNIARPQWESLAATLDLNPRRLVGNLTTLGERLLGALDSVFDGALEEGLQHPIVEVLREALRARAEACLRALAA